MKYLFSTFVMVYPIIYVMIGLSYHCKTKQVSMTDQSAHGLAERLTLRNQVKE